MTGRRGRGESEKSLWATMCSATDKERQQQRREVETDRWIEGGREGI